MKKIIFLFIGVIIAIAVTGFVTVSQGRFGIFIVLAIIFQFVILAFIFSIIRKSQLNKEKLLKTGESAKARILSVSDTGVTINNKPRIALQLEVTPETGLPFNVKIHTLISRFQPVIYQPGMVLQVKYDPNNLDNVVIESSGENVKYGNIPINNSNNYSVGQNNIENKALVCPACGGQIKLPKSLFKKKIVTCNYCGTVIDLHV